MTVKTTEKSVSLVHPDHPGTSIEVLNFGATITSWKIDNVEKLWMSQNAYLDGSGVINGGIPLVFPRFGTAKGDHAATDALPLHGFAHSANWKYLGNPEPTKLQFELTPGETPESFKKIWPYDFRLVYNIELGAADISVDITVINPSTTTAFDFNFLVHTYFYIPEIEDVSLTGFSNLPYWDKNDGLDHETGDEKVEIHEPIDRVFKGTPSKSVIEYRKKPLYEIEATGLPDTVVWNPWQSGAEQMVDFMPKSDYHHMLCVEKGFVTQFKNLTPGETFKAGVKYTAF